MAALISPADGRSLSTGYYSSPKLVGLHIFLCVTSELESSIQMKYSVADTIGSSAFFFICGRNQTLSWQSGFQSSVKQPGFVDYCFKASIFA